MVNNLIKSFLCVITLNKHHYNAIYEDLSSEKSQCVNSFDFFNKIFNFALTFQGRIWNKTNRQDVFFDYQKTTPVFRPPPVAKNLSSGETGILLLWEEFQL